MNKQKILVVDDNPTGLHTLLAILKDDYRVFIATNGENALQKAILEPKPDIILLDVIMPEMDGYEVCKRLKKNPLTKDIPVVFITALEDDTDEAEGLSLGAIDYIHKPFNSAIVKARVRNHLALVSAHKIVCKQNKQLKESAKLKDDIDRITRHDLKSPLSIIVGYPQLLKLENNLTPEQKQYISEIESAGYQMLDMINLSLDLYKMEVGTYQLEAIELDVIPILKKIVSENRTLIDSKNIKINIWINNKELQNEYLIVNGETLLCYTMLQNLIKNAVEASPHDKEIKINLIEKDGEIIIKIRNFGAVPEPIRDNFFEKYVTANKKYGTGLGTYSAYLTAKTQKGKIELDTSEDSMTTIIITLPK